MPPAKPMLGDVELQLVQKLEAEEDLVLAQHDVPALEGDFLQRLGRRATRFSLTGVLSGPEVADGLKTLREKFRAAEPVSFVADIATATTVDQVLIEEMGVREPQSLEEWADLPLGKNVLPWLQGEELRRLQRMLEFFRQNLQ